MSPDSIPQISLGTAALVIFAVCAGFVVLRGLTRLLVATVVLSLSAWLAFAVWQEAPALSIRWTGSPQTWITHGLPALSFIVSVLLLRKMAKAIARPFGNSAAAGPRSLPATVLRLVLSLIPTSLLWLVGATLIHHTGSIAELRAHSEKSGRAGEDHPDGFGPRLKSAIETALPAAWLDRLDPLTRPSRLTLAKLISDRSESPGEPLIDPATGKPVPRAIIVDDPALQNLAREGKFGTLLRHPLLTKALDDPAVKKLLRDLKL